MSIMDIIYGRKTAASGRVNESLTKSGSVKRGSRLDKFMRGAYDLVYDMEHTNGWKTKVTKLLKKKRATKGEIKKIIEDLPGLIHID